MLRFKVTVRPLTVTHSQACRVRFVDNRGQCSPAFRTPRASVVSQRFEGQIAHPASGYTNATVSQRDRYHLSLGPLERLTSVQQLGQLLVGDYGDQLRRLGVVDQQQ